MEAEEICDHPNSQRGSKKKNENCKRFTDEQVKLLESIFKVETKLEPRKKLQLARDIGLQPRQVAIWFQNRRARWKSKQLEHEYRILKENFDNLNGKFESLKTEKETLLTQLRALNDQIEKNHGGGGGGGSSSRSQDSKDNEMYTSSENGEVKNNSPNCSNARLLEDNKSVKEVDYDDDDDDDDTRRRTKYLRLKEETEYWNMDEFGEDSSLASPEYCFDQSCDNSKWWDFCA